MKSFFASVKFLTLLPVPAAWAGDDTSLRRSVYFFPVTGLLIGGAVAAATLCMGRILPQILVNILAVACMTGISKGLHLDGLADSADALLSSKSRTEKLAIMRAGNSGPMGVAAVVFSILLKVAALFSVPGPLYLPAILMMPVAGRCAAVMQLGILPYARREGGLASVFCGVPGKKRMLLCTGVFLCLAGYGAAGWTGVAAAGAALAGTSLFSWCSYRALGGYTGDTLGASVEIGETSAGLTFAMVAYLQTAGMPG